MQKTTWLLIMASLLVFLLAGCGNASKDTESSETENPSWGRAVSESERSAQVLESAAEPEMEPEAVSAPAQETISPGRETADSESPTEPDQAPEAQPEPQEDHTMQITIGDQAFTVTLEENETTAALLAHLPLTLDMSELHGNEKYNYLDFSLPTDAYAPGHIEIGDVMLYGDDCLVVFYERFSTAYGYTRIGWIQDTTNLQDAVGDGSVQMTFTANG